MILRDKTKSFGLGIGMGICEYPYPDKKKKNTFIFNEYVSGTRNLIWEGKVKKGLLHGEGIISLENNLRKKFNATFENGVLLSINVNYWSPYWAPTINPFTLNKVEVENGMITQLMYTANGDTIIKNTSLFPFQFFCLNLEESSSGMATIKYKNNGTYFGMLKIWQLHGYGEYKTVNQGSYTGYFYNGQRHGFGVTSFPNKDLDSGYYQFGQLLEGVFVLDGVSKKFPICLSGNCQDGFGKASYFVKPNDSTYNTYEGNFVNGLPNGFGVKKCSGFFPEHLTDRIRMFAQLAGAILSLGH